MPHLNEIMQFEPTSTNISETARTLASLATRTLRCLKQVEHDYEEDESLIVPKVILAMPTVNISQPNPIRRPRVTCHNCGGLHAMFTCADFLKMTIPLRRKRINELSLCENCLSQAHRTGAPQFNFTFLCRGQFHNSVLCEKTVDERPSEFRAPSNQQTNTNDDHW